MIELNHTIVPSHDKARAAAFYSRILGLPNEGEFAHFIVVRVNQSLTLDFDDVVKFEPHHYAFKVSEEKFDEVFTRVKQEGVAYGSGPTTPDDMQLNDHAGGRGFYFRDPDGHLLELLTAG